MSDFTYSVYDGLYAVFPETTAAEVTVSGMIQQFGSNKLLPSEFAAFRKQARAAGYSVHKAKPSAGKLAADDLLKELGE